MFRIALLFSLWLGCVAPTDVPQERHDAGTPDASATGGGVADGQDASVGGGVAAGQDAGPRPDAGLGEDSGVDAGALDGGGRGDAGVMLARATFMPSMAVFPNPERGWYVWASTNFGASVDTGALDAASASGVRLAYAVVDLGAFRSTPLPAQFLTDLSARFGVLRSRGFKAVVRFAYDYSAGGNDAPATQIVSHLQQLAPVLAANADTLAVFQAGFIGAWGEWHSSKHSNSFGYMTNPGVTQAQADANRLLVRDAVLAAAPPGVPVAFRYPGDLIKWYPQPSQQSRAGLHNDCWLAGPTDTGTYASMAERTYIASLSADATFGGETCDADTPLRTSCADVRAEGARYHVSYLNREFFAGFITSWTNGGCLDEVTRQMGYRFQLDEVSHPQSVQRGSTLRVTVALRNVGWARLFSARPLVATLIRGTERLTGTGTTALSTLPAQAMTASTLTLDVPVPVNASPGSYSVALSVPDVFPRTATDARFSIRFANAESASQRWEAAEGRFTTGSSVLVE